MIFGTAKGQVSRSQADLSLLHQSVLKLPSFKEQVKDNSKLNFNLGRDFVFDGDETSFQVFMKLCGLISPIRDNHLSFYSITDSTLTAPSSFEMSKSKIDSAVSAADSSDPILGTYYAGKYTVQLVKIDGLYHGVMESEDRFLLQFILQPTTPNHFDIIRFGRNATSYRLDRNVVFINQRLSGTGWSKYNSRSFVELPFEMPTYDFKTINEDISYLRLGSFATNNKTIALSDEFFGTIKSKELKRHLIVDLRNNGGGGYKTSKKFLGFVRRFKGQVHLLVNNYTVSNAEQFTIDLKDSKNVTIYGETTRGTIAYGSNMGVRIQMPSKRFAFYITDMKSRAKDLPYESYGIDPTINLDPFKVDWVEQVIEHIKKK